MDDCAVAAMDSAGRCASVALQLKSAVGGGKGGMKPDPMMLMKLIPLFTDAKGFTDSMVGMVTEVVQDAIEMIDKCNEAMDNCIASCCRLCGDPDGNDASDPPPANCSDDIDSLEELKDAFVGGNLLGIAQAGPNAIMGIEEKIGIVKTLTDAIIGFCTAVIEITKALTSGNIAKIPSEIGKIFRCLRLSDMIKQFAEELLRFVNVLADMFKAMIDKINQLNPLNMAGNVAGMVGDVAGMAGVPSGGQLMGKLF